MNSIPAITKNLLIINVLCFLGQMAAEAQGLDLTHLFGLHFFLANDFRWYQLMTYMFLHGGLGHLFFNMFAVWMFGRTIEFSMSSKRFLVYYLVCGIGAGLTQELVQYIHYLILGLHHYDQISMGLGNVIPVGEYLNQWTTIGASGAVYGILLAFGMTYPNERIFIFPIPIPIMAKYFVIGYAAIELFEALGRPGDGIAHFAHLGGMLFGLLLILYWRNGGRNRRKNNFSDFYNRNGGSDHFRNWFGQRFQKKDKPRFTIHRDERFGQEMAYRKKNKEEEEEMDHILDKIRKNGYEALSPEEKQRLFDFSKKGNTP